MGLVYAFSVRDGKATAVLSGSPAAGDADYVWHHVNLSTEPGRRWLDRHSGLPPQLVTTFVNRAEEPGVYSFGTGVMMILEDRLKDFDQDTQELSELHVWVEPGRVITARWHPLSGPDRLRFRFEVGAAPPTAMGLILDLMGEIVTDIEGISGKTGDRLDSLADRVLDGSAAGVAAELGAIRREATALRRRILPLRRVTGTLGEADLPWVRTEDRLRFGPLESRVDKAGAEVMECQEQARLLQDEISARLAERNGRNLYILSVLTAVLLPLNLITGIFGMNVAGLPGLRDDMAFLWVMLGMAAVGLGVIAAFKLVRWF